MLLLMHTEVERRLADCTELKSKPFGTDLKALQLRRLKKPHQQLKQRGEPRI